MESSRHSDHGDEDFHADPDPVDVMRMFVLSQDALRGTRIDHTVSSGWPHRPPLFEGKRSNHELKEMCRTGIPPALRCAVWVTSIVRASHPQQPREISDEYGTLGKVRAVDAAWSEVLKRTFPDPSDEEHAYVPDYGLRREQLDSLLSGADHGGDPIPERGMKSLTRVLCAINHMHNVEYAPLVPDVAAVLLNCMPEGYAYAALREMVGDASRYLPVDKVDHYSVCRTFADVMKKLYPKTAMEMEENGSLSPRGLDPIFRRFFTTLLRYEHVLRIMDIYAVEGSKVIFRVGVALIAMWKTALKTMQIKDASMWWSRIRDFAHSSTFDFEELVRKAYAPVGSRLRKRIVFPRRRTINRMVRFNEDWAAEHMSVPRADGPAKPMGFVQGEVELKLARPAVVRSMLAGWLPPAYAQSTKLELLYSTDVHGRSLGAMYSKCSRTKRTITLLEVLDTGSIVGMYASHAWSPQLEVYGNGECFLFRAIPDPKVFKWKPLAPGSFDDDDNEALNEQFQVCRKEFLSMGGNQDGSGGLRLNEHLTRGESATAMGFSNDPLAGHELPQFNIGLLEVYRLVREVDGKPVDGEDDPVWDLEGLDLQRRR